MFAVVGLTGLTSAGVAAAKSVTGSSVTDIIILVAAVVTALGVIARMLHLPEIRRGFRDFLQSWNGQPKRPGVEAVPGFPEQMADTKADLTKMKADVHTIKGRDGALVVALEQIAASAAATAAALIRVENRANVTDERISEHRRRNEETARQLQKAVEQTAADLERKLAERNAALDRTLAGMSQDRAQNEAMRASLTEIGLTEDIPHPPTTHRDNPPSEGAV
jgi:hypothetical protein